MKLSLAPLLCGAWPCAASLGASGVSVQDSGSRVDGVNFRFTVYGLWCTVYGWDIRDQGSEIRVQVVGNGRNLSFRLRPQSVGFAPPCKGRKKERHFLHSTSMTNDRARLHPENTRGARALRICWIAPGLGFTV